MNRIASLLIAATVLTATTGIARADHPSEDSWDGVAVGFLVVGSIELAPPILLVVGLAVRPESKAFAVTEVVAGAVAATTNTWLAIAFARPDCPSCREWVPYFAGIAVLDLAVVAHGTYLLATHKPAPTLELGTARGTFVPTVVSDGKAMAPGLGLGGTF